MAKEGTPGTDVCQKAFSDLPECLPKEPLMFVCCVESIKLHCARQARVALARL